MSAIERCGAQHEGHRCTSLMGHTGTHADLGHLSDGRFGFYEWSHKPPTASERATEPSPVVGHNAPTETGAGGGGPTWRRASP